MRVLIPFLLIGVALAGCSDDGGPDGATDPIDDDDTPHGPRDLRTELTIDDAAPAPTWSVGDWFGHHIFFGAQDTAGTHINTIVVEDRGDSWLLAPDDPGMAKWEAAWDFPMLGSIGKDMQTTAFASDWGIYQFPMQDGDTWTTTLDPLFQGPRELTLTATYNPSITTPYGNRPGFDIVGVNSNGTVELETDYVPEIGWYNQLSLYDLTTPAEEDHVIHVRAMGRGNNWTGTYYIDQAIPMTIWGGFLTPFAADQSSPPHHESFTMSGDGYELYGIVGAGASVGVSSVNLIDPTGVRHAYDLTHTEPDPNAGGFLFEFVEIEAVPGQWELGWIGAGAVAFGFAWLWEIVETEHIMA